MLRCLWLWTLCSRLFLFPASSHRGTPKEERGEGYGSVTVYGVRFGSALSAQPGQIRDQRPLAIGNGECSMPPRGPGWGRGGGNQRECLGTTLYTESVVLQPLLFGKMSIMKSSCFGQSGVPETPSQRKHGLMRQSQQC